MKWLQQVLRACLAMALFVGAAAQANPQSEYVLGPGDVIRVSVYQSPDLTLQARISEAGAISYPLLGTVKLGGLSISDAERKIATGLKEGNFLKQPQVSILVEEVKGNRVSVLGLVNRPGRYPLELANTKLSEVLAQAGGAVAGSGSDIVVITGMRSGKPFRKEVDVPLIFAANNAIEDPVLQNGDTVYVERAPYIFVYGEVKDPGARILQRDMTLLQVLAASGGLTLRGTDKGIRVHRRDPATGEIQVIQPQMNDKLKKDDVVYIKESLF